MHAYLTIKKGRVDVSVGSVKILEVHNVKNIKLGSGNDKVIFAKGAILDGDLDGEEGTDTLSYEGLNPNSFFGGYSAKVQVNLSSEIYTLPADPNSQIESNKSSTIGGKIENFENVTGGRNDDILVANNTGGTLKGGKGNDERHHERRALCLPPGPTCRPCQVSSQSVRVSETSAK